MVDRVEVAPVFVSATCEGELCRCGRAAVRKVGEEIPCDDPRPRRHNLTAYVCAEHYAEIMGPVGAEQVGMPIAAMQPAKTQVDEVRVENNKRLVEKARDLAYAGDFLPDDLGGAIGTMSLRNPDGPALLEIVKTIAALEGE